MKAKQKLQPSQPYPYSPERDRLRCSAASTRQELSPAEARRAEAEDRVAAALRENLRKRKAQKQMQPAAQAKPKD